MGAREQPTSREPADALTKLLDDAPLDDEPITPEEEAAVAEADAEIAAGQAVSLEEVRREFGL